jgi:hypothetical protein
MIHPAWRFCLFLLVPLLTGCPGFLRTSENDLAKIRAADNQRIAALAAEYDARVEKRRSDYIESHPGLSESARNAVKKGLLAVGLLPEELEASWGIPRKKNISDGVNGRREQWIYDESTYVYFDDGKVTSWSISR